MTELFSDFIEDLLRLCDYLGTYAVAFYYCDLLFHNYSPFN